MFFFLAGVGAFLRGKEKSTEMLRQFLWTRGLWLIFLEFTVVGSAWSFQFPWGFFGVIWALGASMLILALLVSLPMRWIALLAISAIFGHDLLDSVRPQQLGPVAWGWSILHARGDIVMPFGIHEFVLFPLIPLSAVMAAGYVFGQVYSLGRPQRRKLAVVLGLSISLAFVFLRLTNLYGNPPPGLGGVSQGDWHPQPTLAKSLILFLDVEKYPPSLQYLFMTIGPSLVLLALFDRDRPPRGTSVLLTFGRAPMFFYILHLFLIHWLAILIATFVNQPTHWLFQGAIFSQTPPEYGHGLAFVYGMWFVVVIALYFPCRWFAAFKQRRGQWWWSYL
jgi:uncharacterized membrane protein